MDCETYWKKFIEEKGIQHRKHTSYYFCDNEEDANELAQLVVSGKKRATASSVLSYEYEKEPLPQVGDLNIITDFFDQPMCIVETTKVNIVLFKDVTPEMAALEGEGDLSLKYWREGHKRFFSRECEEFGEEFSEDMPVVFEQFKVVYI